jgi:quinohemoprotein ethanol dehydrogenase
MRWSAVLDSLDLERRALVFSLWLLLTGPTLAAAPGQVDEARLDNADREPDQWLTSGRDAGGSYFSPLEQINEQTVKELGYAWQYHLGTSRGLEASPLVIDGVMYAAGNFGRVYALDAATGAQRWTFVPEIDMQWARYACCDAVNRGLAVWRGMVYVGTIDGYMYALDAATGKPIWKTDTLLGRKEHVPYTLVGAPVVARDTVIIGNGGAEYPGVRGYISAYDLKTGVLKWRFFTVPRNPSLGPQDQPHLMAAIKTWDPRHRWEAGGGGTVWDGLTYDAKTDLVFLGTANVSPYDTHEDGRNGGDELYTDSVIAVHAATGTIAWYFQEVPDDRWDLDSTAKFIATSLTIDGARHDVLLHAVKSGYFYVYDRATGKVLAANNFAYVNWAKGLDPVTYRPIPNPDADYEKKPAIVWPSMFGAHVWHPMSFSPVTGLAYIPALEMPNIVLNLANRPLKESDGFFTILSILPDDYDPAHTRNLYGPLPSLDSLTQGSHGPLKPLGILRAWDPVKNRLIWQVPGTSIADGGVMSTAGNLVFRGDARGFLNVYTADAGKLVRSIDVGTSIMAAPISYAVGGEQYIAFMAGYGGSSGFLYDPDTAAYKYGNAGRIVALKLGGGAVPKPSEILDTPIPPPPDAAGGTPEQIAQGEILYNRHCNRCHVFGRGLVPDLRRMSPATHGLFLDIVLKGAFLPKGMGRFDDVLSREDATAIHAYLSDQARQASRREKAAPRDEKSAPDTMSH